MSSNTGAPQLGKPGLISSRDLRRAIRQAEVLGLPLGDEIQSDGTRSDLEGDFLRLCRRRGLPAPKVNVPVGPHRGRDLDLRALGFQVIRLSEKQVNDEPRRVAGVVSAALRVGADGGVGEKGR